MESGGDGQVIVFNQFKADLRTLGSREADRKGHVSDRKFRVLGRKVFVTYSKQKRSQYEFDRKRATFAFS